MAIMIIVDALGADRRRTCLAEEVDDLGWMLGTWNALNASMEQRLGIVCRQEVNDLIVSTTFHGVRFDDLLLASWTLSRAFVCQCVLCRLFTVGNLATHIDDFNKALPTKRTSTVCKDEWRPEVQWLESLDLSLLVNAFQTLNILHGIE